MPGFVHDLHCTFLLELVHQGLRKTDAVRSSLHLLEEGRIGIYCLIYYDVPEVVGQAVQGDTFAVDVAWIYYNLNSAN
jgi:hypothetical protein